MNEELKMTRRSAFTLTEMLVVVAIVVLLSTMVLPALTKMLQSNRASVAKVIVRTMLARAQGYAVANQKYAGIRFQFDRDGWQQGRQYMVLIEHDGGTTYRAVPDVKVVTLPKGVGVLSNNAIIFNPVNQTDINLNNDNLDDSELGLVPGDVDIINLSGSTTFSVIFSPTGQLVIEDVKVRTRFTPYPEGSTIIYDTVFNHSGRVLLNSEDVGKALLFMDGFFSATEFSPFNNNYDPMPWCYEEPSATGFYIFEVEAMADVPDPALRFTDYIGTMEPFLVNRYTAGLIEE